jgi:hypothetical protein
VYCETRWTSDYPVVRFLCDHFDLVSDLLAAERFFWWREIMHLMPILEQLFLMVLDLESDKCAVAEVYPGIDEMLLMLRQYHAQCLSELRKAETEMIDRTEADIQWYQVDLVRE